MQIDPKKNYTAREAAELLKMTEATVKKHLRCGTAKGVRVGANRRWHVSGAEISRLRSKWNLDALNN
jgi:predicted transcriptional regulator